MAATRESAKLELTLRKVGNSLGVILPRDALDVLGVEKEGDRLVLSKAEDGTLRIEHLDPDFAEKLAVLRDTIKRYKNTLRELAK
jgi:putative addiction module antidote